MKRFRNEFEHDKDVTVPSADEVDSLRLAKAARRRAARRISEFAAVNSSG